MRSVSAGRHRLNDVENAGARRLRRLVTSGALALAGALLAAGGAGAAPGSKIDVSKAANGPITYTKTVGLAGAYSWALTGMPDIDQVRSPDLVNGHPGLPNQGIMWCVPTTGMNILAYLAGLGYSPGVENKDWALAANYDEMTADLLKLGNEMGTDPVNGTGGDGFVNAMTARLKNSGSIATPPMVLSLVSFTQDPNWQGASVKQLALAGLDGSLVAAGIGYYANEADPRSPGSGKIVKRRTGGHFMTAVGASGSLLSLSATLQVRNPATPNNAHSFQSAYATDPHTVVPKTFEFVYQGSDMKDHYYTADVGTWDGSETTLFEGYFKVDPTVVWALKDKYLERIEPYKLVPDPGPRKTIFDLPGRGKPTAVALSAISSDPAVVVEGSSTIWSLDQATGASTRLGRVAGAKALAFGGDDQTLFVAGNRKLVAIDALTHRVVDSRTLSTPVEALQFDDKNDRLVAAGGDRLRFFDIDLAPVGSRRLSGLRGSGALQVAVAPSGAVAVADGGPTVVTSGAGARASQVGTNTAPLVARRLPGAAGADGLVVDDAGNILVARDGRVQLLDPSGRPVRGNPFPGRADDVFAIRRSFSNANPELLQPTLDFNPIPLAG